MLGVGRPTSRSLSWLNADPSAAVVGSVPAEPFWAVIFALEYMQKPATCVRVKSCHALEGLYTIMASRPPLNETPPPSSCHCCVSQADNDSDTEQVGCTNWNNAEHHNNMKTAPPLL